MILFNLSYSLALVALLSKNTLQYHGSPKKKRGEDFSKNDFEYFNLINGMGIANIFHWKYVLLEVLHVHCHTL